VGQGGGVDNQVIVNTDQSKNSDVYILQLGSENESKITSKGGNSNSGSWGNFTTTGQVGSRNGAVINIAETHSNQNIVAVGQGGFDNNSWVEVLQGADDNTAVIGLVGTSNETYTSFDGPGVDENSVAVGVNGDNNYVQSIVKADPARINDSPNLVKNNDVTVLVEGDLNRLFTEQKGSDSSIDIQIMSGGESNELSIVQTNNSNVSSVVIDNSNRNVLIANQAGGSTLDVNLANDSNDNSFQVNQSNGGYLLATGNGASNNVGIVVQY
jgi:hypothetical protein